MSDFIDKLPLLQVSTDVQNFDYFIDKDELKKELDKNDDEFSCHLIKQYARRIQSMEKELLAIEIEDGRTLITIKKSDLYLCCFAGMAKMNWDLYRIAQGVPCMTVRSLLRQLLIYAFPDKIELLAFSEVDIFNEIAKFPSDEFTEDNLFIAWLYARWILHIDRTSRFPTHTVKQSVANPALQADLVLLTAEQHGLCVSTTRSLAPLAATFLQQLESLPIDRVRIPVIECFLNKNYMTENLNVWEENIEPDFLESDLFCPMELIINKTRYDLFLANYAAGQFRSSKNLLKLLLGAKPDFSTVIPELYPYVKFDVESLEFYAIALRLQSPTEPAIRDSLVKLSNPLNIEAHVKAITHGSNIRRVTMITNEAKERTKKALENQGKLSKNVIQKLRNDAALFCIKEALSSSVQCSSKKIVPPTEDYFNRFTGSGPSLFTHYTTVNAETFDQIFLKNKLLGLRFPERFLFPQEIADFINARFDREMQLYLYTLIGKAKQLENVSLITQWEKFVNIFLIKASFNPKHKEEISPSFIIEALNIKLRPAYTTIFFRNPEIVSQMFSKVNTLLVTYPPLKLLKFFRYYVPSLFNIGQFDVILSTIQTLKSEIIRNNVTELFEQSTILFNFLTSFVDLMKHLNDDKSMEAKKQFFEHYVIILTLFSHEGPGGKRLLFSFSDFLMMIQNISEPNAIKQLLNYTIQIFNRTLIDNTNHFLVPTALHRNCFILHDSYKHDPADARLFNSWGSRNDIVHKILDVCLRISNRVCSTDEFVLRVTGDYTFVINNFHASLRFYLNCILVLTNYLSHPLTYNNVTMIDDLFWKKIITCLYELKRPTEAAITGQLVTQMFEVLPHIYEILCSHECEDSTSDYFHLIGDLAIFEAMSAAYGRQAFGRRQFQLIERVLTRAFHGNSPKFIHMHEGLRRKTQWIRFLCSRVFDSCDCV